MKIFLVEDEVNIADFVTQGLTNADFEVTWIADGLAAQNLLRIQEFDAVVLDIMLPQVNGFDLLKTLRASGKTTPVIFLSAKSDLADRLQGFELGANDFLPKPFFVEELVARIKAITLTKVAPNPPAQVVVNQLRLDIVNRQVAWHDVSAVLSQREFVLLKYLMRSPGQIFTRKQILQNVWNINFDPQTNLVDVCIQRIKRKLLRKDTDMDSPIESVRGIGYRIRVD
jgi:DNA-binding response OmpR family regulator